MLLAHPLQELRGEEVVADVGSAEGELAAVLLSTLGDLLGYLGVLDHLEVVFNHPVSGLELSI